MSLSALIDREGDSTPLQYSCLENPIDRGAWWAAVHGVAKSRTQLSDFPFTFHFHALEKEMATHSSVLAWRIPGTGEPGGLPSMGSHRVGHNWSDLAAAAALIQSEGDITKFYKYVALGKCPNLSKVKISSLLRQDFLLFCHALKSWFREKNIYKDNIYSWIQNSFHKVWKDIHQISNSGYLKEKIVRDFNLKEFRGDSLGSSG